MQDLSEPLSFEIVIGLRPTEGVQQSFFFYQPAEIRRQKWLHRNFSFWCIERERKKKFQLLKCGRGRFIAREKENYCSNGYYAKKELTTKVFWTLQTFFSVSRFKRNKFAWRAHDL